MIKLTKKQIEPAIKRVSAALLDSSDRPDSFDVVIINEVAEQHLACLDAGWEVRALIAEERFKKMLKTYQDDSAYHKIEDEFGQGGWAAVQAFINLVCEHDWVYGPNEYDGKHCTLCNRIESSGGLR